MIAPPEPLSQNMLNLVAGVSDLIRKENKMVIVQITASLEHVIVPPLPEKFLLVFLSRMQDADAFREAERYPEIPIVAYTSGIRDV